MLFFIELFFADKIFAQTGLDEIKFEGTNPGKLKMFFHLSEKFTVKKIPLVVVLHGCTQTSATVADESGWNVLADKYEFNVLYPQQNYMNNSGACFNWYYKADVEKDKGEALSIRQMIAHAVSQFNIDTTQIFIYGLSAGAAMSMAMLADYPQLFKAGASLAGGPYMAATNPLQTMPMMYNAIVKTEKEWGDLVRAQNPDYKGAYPPLIILYGRTDIVVNYKNSIELVKQWANICNMNAEHADEIVNDFENSEGLTRSAWKENDIEKIVVYDFENLGHALPVDPGTAEKQGGQTGLFSVDKNFFSTYWIAKDFGLIKE